MTTDIEETSMDSETREIINDMARQAALNVFALDGAVTAANAADAIAAAVTAALNEWMLTYYEIVEDEPEKD